MLCRRVFTGLIATMLLQAAPGTISAQPVDYRGEAWVRAIHQPETLDESSGLARLDLALSGDIGDTSLRWLGEARAQYDSLQSRGENSWLREAGLEYELVSQTRLFAGKRYLAWGRADEINPIDVINAEDLHQFALHDREDRKLGRPLVQLSSRHRNQALHLVYAPDNDTHLLPDPDNIWCGITCRRLSTETWNQRFSGTGINLTRGEDEPQRDEWAARYTTGLGTVDLGAVAHYGYSRFPVFGRTFTAPDQARIFQAHRRRPAYGFDGALTAGQFTFRWEGLWIRGETFHLDPRAPGYSMDRDGLEERDLFEGILGLDFFGPAQIYANIQYFQRHISGDTDPLVRPLGNKLVTTQIERSFYAIETDITYEITIDVTDGSEFHELIAAYQFSQQWTLSGALVHFSAKSDSTFGQFHDNRGIYAKLRYQF